MYYQPMLRQPALVEIIEYFVTKAGKRMAVIEFLSDFGFFHKAGDQKEVPLTRLYATSPGYGEDWEGQMRD